MANDVKTYHDGYLSFLEDEKNPDIEGLKKALITNVGLLSVCEDKTIIGLEADHLLKLGIRINELMKKYPLRIWHIGPFYTQRNKLRCLLIEAKANAVIAGQILIHFSK